MHKALLSVARAADMGFRCILDKKGGCLEDRETGEQIPIYRKGNLYVMKIWAREIEAGREASGFQRRG